MVEEKQTLVLQLVSELKHICWPKLHHCDRSIRIPNKDALSKSSFHRIHHHSILHAATATAASLPDRCLREITSQIYT